MDRSRAFKKGTDFENTIFLKLKKSLKDSLIIHDVHIPHKPNPAQIDILVVRGWSFHVLELKNYEHSLTGKIEDKKWTAKSDWKSYEVQNPIQQNTVQSFKLIQALKDKGFPPPREIKGFIIVPYSCRLEVDNHLKSAILTVDALIDKVSQSKPGDGNLARLREVLLEWKKK